jgi:hypothetical protein
MSIFRQVLIEAANKVSNEDNKIQVLLSEEMLYHGAASCKNIKEFVTNNLFFVNGESNSFEREVFGDINPSNFHRKHFNKKNLQFLHR